MLTTTLILFIKLLKHCYLDRSQYIQTRTTKVTTLRIKAMFIRNVTLRDKAVFFYFRDTFMKHLCRDKAGVRVEGNLIKVLLHLHSP